VHRPLEEQREDGGANVEPGAAPAAALASGAGATEWTAGAEATEVRAASAERESEPAAEPAAVHVLLVVFVVEPHDLLQTVVDT
jgi:hypothetical protein